MVSFKIAVCFFCSLFMAVVAIPTGSEITTSTGTETTIAIQANPTLEDPDPWYLNLTSGIREYTMQLYIQRYGRGDERPIPDPRVLNGADYTFWIGKNTSVMECPFEIKQVCGIGGSDTILRHDPATSTLWLFTSDPVGDQQVYIDPTGRLAYLPNRSDMKFPDGSITDGFKIHRGFYGQYLLDNFSAKSGWSVCPVEKGIGPWQLFTETKNENLPTGNSSDCIGINVSFGGASDKPEVWAYT
ncbi:hypothetical protein TWF694_003579 [Orbilia ellipsospora]|uniref:Uncharacterized protein n=1 Tax=Orbilia ellipsospora TaxID=2528407 RepID=A0AAV9X4K6_9PEZI